MTTLWIGGTSSLTRTYLNAFGSDDLVLAGLETVPPDWVPSECPYHSLDLTSASRLDTTTTSTTTCSTTSTRLLKGITTLIIGVRAPLVTGDGNAHEHLIVGLKALLEEATHVKHIIHISSVAVVNHLQTQINVNERTPIPPIHDYQGSYDRFKRTCEELINEHDGSSSVHLRVSAIFSDSQSCIQCGALQLQSRIGPATMPLRIDCNSGRNVASAIHLLLRQRNTAMAPVYYYTRPYQQGQERSGGAWTYGDYLDQYLQAYQIRYLRLIVPFAVVTYFTLFVHWIVYQTPLHKWSGLAVSFDYLLQVAFREHTFDCSLFQRDFPEIMDMEESILECFVRRKAFLEVCDNNQKK